MFFLRRPLHLIFIWIVLSLIFSITAWVDYSTIRPQASMDPTDGIYAAQLLVDTEFPRDVYSVPFEFIGGNVLTREVLTEILEKSETLRESDFGKEYLVNFEIPDIGSTDKLGFYSVADGVNDILKTQGLSLRAAKKGEVNAAVQLLLKDEIYGSYFRATLSQKAKFRGGKWSSEVFSLLVSADNNKLGGGVFRRNVGGDSKLLQKEQFNRDVEEALQGKSYNLLGIGIDLNLEANDEGYALITLGLITALLVTLMSFVGILFRSFRLFILTGLGLLTLFVWIRGFSLATFGLVSPSLTTEIILPVAFMAFGVDFLIHVISKYKENISFESKNLVRTMFQSILNINVALLLAMVTTAIAFGTNSISSVEAVQSFAITGIFAAISAYFIMGIIIPIIFVGFEEEGAVQKRIFKLNVGNLMNNAIRHRKIVLLTLILVTIISIGGTFLIEKKLDPRDFLNSESNFVISLDEQKKHFGDFGGEEASIYIKGNFDNIKVKIALSQLMTRLENNSNLAHTKEGALVLPYGQPEVHKIDRNIYTQRIIFQVINTSKQENIKGAFLSLQKDMEIFAGITEYEIVGSAFTRDASLDAITDSLTSTLLLAIVLIFLTLLIVFRSVKYALITISPMLLVIVWTYGFMGIFGFSLNFITATIASIALGVGIDYSVHVVQRFRIENSEDKSLREVIYTVGDTTGFAVVIAAVSSIVGFIFLSMAPMPLFSTYGILAAVMIIYSLLTTLIVLPILLKLVK